MGPINNDIDLQEYMSDGVQRIVSDVMKATLRNPRESALFLKFGLSSRASSKRRQKLEEQGEHVPPFLIASITSSCNLHCAGCYSRCNNATTDTEPVEQLSSSDWKKIFDDADDMGVSFIFLASGEPMLRRDVITEATEKKNILFPMFTVLRAGKAHYFR